MAHLASQWIDFDDQFDRLGRPARRSRAAGRRRPAQRRGARCSLPMKSFAIAHRSCTSGERPPETPSCRARRSPQATRWSCGTPARTSMTTVFERPLDARPPSSEGAAQALRSVVAARTTASVPRWRGSSSRCCSTRWFDASCALRTSGRSSAMCGPTSSTVSPNCPSRCEPMRPLDGLRVIDAATIVAGPFAGSILGEFGAEVVKVEQPEIGDPMRRLGTASPGGDTFWWFSETRNKQSVELDLRTDAGAEAFRALSRRRRRGHRELPNRNDGRLGPRLRSPAGRQSSSHPTVAQRVRPHRTAGGGRRRRSNRRGVLRHDRSDRPAGRAAGTLGIGGARRLRLRGLRRTRRSCSPSSNDIGADAANSSTLRSTTGSLGFLDELIPVFIATGFGRSTDGRRNPSIGAAQQLPIV